MTVGSGHVYRIYVRQFRAQRVEGDSCSAALNLKPGLKTGWYRLKGLPDETVEIITVCVL